MPAAPASSKHDIQPKTRAILYCRSPHTPCGSTLHQVPVRIAPRMSKTLVPNAGHKRWPHSLATMTPPMTHHHPSESNLRPLEHETVAQTAPPSLEPCCSEQARHALCHGSFAGSCRSLGGENPGFEPGNFYSSACGCYSCCVRGSLSCNMRFGGHSGSGIRLRPRKVIFTLCTLSLSHFPLFLLPSRQGFSLDYAWCIDHPRSRSLP